MRGNILRKEGEGLRFQVVRLQLQCVKLRVRSRSQNLKNMRDLSITGQHTRCDVQNSQLGPGRQCLCPRLDHGRVVLRCGINSCECVILEVKIPQIRTLGKPKSKRRDPSHADSILRHPDIYKSSMGGE